MALRTREPWDVGQSLGISFERLADELTYDPADQAFKASPADPVMVLIEGTGSYAGRYTLTIADTPTIEWLPGDYASYLHDLTRPGSPTIGSGGLFVMHAAAGGQSDDSTVIPSGAGVAPPSVEAIAAHLLDAEMIDGGTLREAICAIARQAAADLTQPVNGSTTTFKKFKAAGDGIRSANGPTGRTVTILP